MVHRTEFVSQNLAGTAGASRCNAARRTQHAHALVSRAACNYRTSGALHAGVWYHMLRLRGLQSR